MTNQEMDHSGDPHDLVTGYVLDVLDPQELLRFTEHLDDCPYCQDSILELTDTVADLASSSHVVPPQALEDHLMASLFGETPGDAGWPVPSVTSGSQDSSSPEPEQLSSRRRWVWPAAAAAAFVLAAALVTVLDLGRSDETGHLLAEAQLAHDIASAPDVHSMPLNLPQGNASVVVSPGMDKAAVMASDLPAPPSGQEYHVWTMHSDGTVASAGSFTPDSSGSAAIMLHTQLEEATGFTVTVDDPSLTQPTSAPIAGVDL